MLKCKLQIQDRIRKKQEITDKALAQAALTDIQLHSNLMRLSPLKGNFKEAPKAATTVVPTRATEDDTQKETLKTAPTVAPIATATNQQLCGSFC